MSFAHSAKDEKDNKGNKEDPMLKGDYLNGNNDLGTCCSICLELPNNPVVLRGGHTFCKACLDTHRLRSNTNPINRAPIKSDEPFPNRMVGHFVLVTQRLQKRVIEQHEEIQRLATDNLAKENAQLVKERDEYVHVNRELLQELSAARDASGPARENEELKRQVKALQERDAAREKQMADLQAKAQQEYLRHQTELSAAQQARAAAEQRGVEQSTVLRALRIQLTAEINSLHSQLTAAEQTSAAAEKQVHEQSTKNVRLNTEVVLLQARLSEAQYQLSTAEQRLDGEERQLDQLRHKLHDLKMQHTQETHELRMEIISQASQVESLNFHRRQDKYAYERAMQRLTPAPAPDAAYPVVIGLPPRSPSLLNSAHTPTASTAASSDAKRGNDAKHLRPSPSASILGAGSVVRNGSAYNPERRFLPRSASTSKLPAANNKSSEKTPDSIADGIRITNECLESRRAFAAAASPHRRNALHSPKTDSRFFETLRIKLFPLSKDLRGESRVQFAIAIRNHLESKFPHYSREMSDLFLHLGGVNNPSAPAARAVV